MAASGSSEKVVRPAVTESSTQKQPDVLAEGEMAELEADGGTSHASGGNSSASGSRSQPPTVTAVNLDPGTLNAIVAGVVAQLQGSTATSSPTGGPSPQAGVVSGGPASGATGGSSGTASGGSTAVGATGGGSGASAGGRASGSGTAASGSGATRSGMTGKWGGGGGKGGGRSSYGCSFSLWDSPEMTRVTPSRVAPYNLYASQVLRPRLEAYGTGEGGARSRGWPSDGAISPRGGGASAQG